MDERFRSDQPIDEQTVIISRSLRLAIVLCAIVFPVVFCVLLKPTAAEATWTTFARIIQIEGHSSAPSFNLSSANLAALCPQQQAEILLTAAVDKSPGAAEQILGRVNSWRGHLKTTSKLSGLVDTALNSPDLNVRAAAIETELAENNLAKSSGALSNVIARVDNEPSARPWGLWMIGALGDRGVEPQRDLAKLITYTHDRDEKTRYWAVEGLSVLGSDESIQPLLAVFRSDSSASVRDRAACALAQSGMLTKSQRLSAVSALIEDASDSSLGAEVHELAYHALRGITGKNFKSDPAAWRNWWAANATR